MERDVLLLFKTLRNDDVDEELFREARIGRGEHLLEKSPGAGEGRKLIITKP